MLRSWAFMYSLLLCFKLPNACSFPERYSAPALSLVFVERQWSNYPHSNSSIARCAEAVRAVSQFWDGTISKPLLRMKAYEKRNQDLAVIDLFVDRFMSHLSAIFNNLVCIPVHISRIYRFLFPFLAYIQSMKCCRTTFLLDKIGTRFQSPSSPNGFTHFHLFRTL